jgi:UDP-N-acetylglucosamine 2-epimerase (non-hydrolysing)
VRIIPPLGYLDFIALEASARLVGREPDRIIRAAREVLATPPPPPRRPALWDGHAGARIAAALVAGQHAA